MVNEGFELYGYSIDLLTQATALLVERATLMVLIGFSYDKAHLDWQASVRRLVDIFIDGLRCKTPARPSKPSSAARRQRRSSDP
jgi:hypothetical protein